MVSDPAPTYKGRSTLRLPLAQVLALLPLKQVLLYVRRVCRHLSDVCEELFEAICHQGIEAFPLHTVSVCGQLLCPV